jgi:glycosyltransferase involved in cell wall biosynthesis
MSDAVAYVVMGFPRLSESFISNEMLLLESFGMRLRVFAIKAGDAGVAHGSLGALRAPVSYLPRLTSLSGTSLPAWLRANLGACWPAHRRLIARRPLAWLGTCASALAMSWRYRKGPFAPLRKVFIKEFLQAGVIAEQVLAAGDVSQLHGHFCHGATTITWFASRLTGLPFSFTAHAKDIYQADQNPGDLLARKLRAARFVATCTDANRQHLEGCRDGESCHVHTVYHGLDTGFFAPRRVAAEDAAAADAALPRILAVGRFVEKKGLRHLVDACAMARDAGHRFRCTLLGEEGPELPAIRAAILRHGLEAQVELRGPVTHAELREIYASSTLFVLPCLIAGDGDRDGIPNVLAEAMAMGLPVITTAVSGIPEIVDDGHNGLIVPPADVAALARRISELLGDAALRQRLGAAARQTICERFDSRRTTLALQALFEGVGAASHVAHHPREADCRAAEA